MDPVKSTFSIFDVHETTSMPKPQPVTLPKPGSFEIPKAPVPEAPTVTRTVTPVATPKAGTFMTSPQDAKTNVEKFKTYTQSLPAISQTVKEAKGAFIEPVFRAAAEFVTPSGTTITPETPVEKLFWGDKPIKDVKNTGQEYMTSFGASPETAEKYGTPMGVVLGSLDVLSPFTGGESTALKRAGIKFGPEVVNAALKNIAASTDKETIIGIGKEIGVDLTSKADDLVKAGKKKDVEGIINAIKETPGVERKTVTSMKAAENISPEIATAVGEKTGTITPRSTAELASRADSLIKENIDEAVKVAESGKGDISNAVGIKLVEHYSQLSEAATGAEKIALQDKAVDMGVKLAERLTEQGREIQAMSMISKIAPAGVVRWVSREARKAGIDLPPERFREFLSEANAIQNLPEGREKFMRIQKMVEDIGSIAPSPLSKKIVTIWKAGLLTGIKTTGLNIMSNLFHAASETAKDIPAATFDSMRSFITGAPRSKVFTMRGYGKGFKEGIQKGVDFMKTGYDERNSLIKLDYQKVNFGDSKIAKALQKYEETVFRLMGAQDQPFYYGAKSKSLYGQAIASAKNQGLKGSEYKNFINDFVQNPSDEALVNAVNDAQMAVFQNKTSIGEIAAGGIEAAYRRSPALGAIVESQLPFRRTPAAVAMQIYNYTPIGATQRIVSDVISGLKSGNMDYKHMEDSFGRGVVGAGAMWAGGEMYKNGIVNLSYPTNPTEKKLWEAEGRTPNSILIGGKYRNLNTLGPLGNVLLLGGYYQKSLEDTGSPTTALTKTLFAVPKTVVDQTFLKNMSASIKAVDSPDQYMESFLSGMAGSVVPTISSDVANAFDDVQRKTYGGTLSDTLKASVEARIPGLRETLPQKVSSLGEPVKRSGNVLETMLDPSRPSKATDSPVIKEIDRLSKETGTFAIPEKVGQKTSYSFLTPEQNDKAWSNFGGMFNQIVSGMIETSDYQDLSDEDKAKEVKNAIDIARNQAKASILIEAVKGAKTNEEKIKMLQEAESSKFLTQATSDALDELLSQQ